MSGIATEVYPQNLRGKYAIVVGLGDSGRSAISLLLRRGAQVLGTDRAPKEKLPSSLFKLGCDFVVGGHQGVDWAKAHLVVVSPGVPTFPELEIARAAGAEVIGETELAGRFIESPLLCVGGTNGKSTATVLLGHLLEGGDRRVFVGGNLGEPACEAPDQAVEAVVLEVSSFQMERIPTLRPKIALLLNISEDHLDRYEDFAAYAHAKGNCFQNQQPDDVAIYLHGSALCRQQVERGNAKLVTFGPGGDYYPEGDAVVEKESGVRFDLTGSDLYGRHNYLNAAAAIAAARQYGVGAGDIAEGLRRFRALPHRMAFAGKHKGVAFYDDSKATNVGAAVTALLGITEAKGVLIAGGRDKWGAYDSLVSAIREKGRGVVLLGEAGPRLAEAIGDVVPVEFAKSMQGAVLCAFRMAKPGDAVLLSPACSSLDMFKNYADRGDRFSEAVGTLVDVQPEDL